MRRARWYGIGTVVALPISTNGGLHGSLDLPYSSDGHGGAEHQAAVAISIDQPTPAGRGPAAYLANVATTLGVVLMINAMVVAFLWPSWGAWVTIHRPNDVWTTVSYLPVLLFVGAIGMLTGRTQSTQVGGATTILRARMHMAVKSMNNLRFALPGLCTIMLAASAVFVGNPDVTASDIRTSALSAFEASDINGFNSSIVTVNIPFRGAWLPQADTSSLIHDTNTVVPLTARSSTHPTLPLASPTPLGSPSSVLRRTPAVRAAAPTTALGYAAMQ